MKCAAVISDCRDDNAMGRVKSRLVSMLECHVTEVGCETDLEAAGNLVDQLDAMRINGRFSLILANVAPRSGQPEAWGNGSPFAYFQVGHTFVVTTIAGNILALVNKLGLVKAVNQVDIARVAAAAGWADAEWVVTTQFRSFEFLPRLAGLIASGVAIPHEVVAVPSLIHQRCNGDAWWIDNFGNIKTTTLPANIGFVPGGTLTIQEQPVRCYNRLSEVPDLSLGVIVGSSGFAAQRFVEVVVKGGSAAATLGIEVGQAVFSHEAVPVG